MLQFNGGTIGIANTVFTGTKSDDPNYSNVSLLLNGNGTNGSTTFTDSSSNNHTISANGNAQISTAQSKFGGASMSFDGNGDYLTIPDDTSFHLGSDSFTIEFWVYLNSISGNINPINKRQSSGASVQWLYLQINSSGVLQLYATSNSSTWDIASAFNFGNTVSTGQWYHIALVRNVQEFATYVNGTKSSNTFTSSASISTGGSNTVQIGGDPAFNSYYVNGYIDDFRITKGVARYTSNFTPPTAQLPGGDTETFASGLWTSSSHISQIRNELWPGFILPIVTDGLILHLDAGDSNSYSGSGTTWTDLSGNGYDVVLQNGPVFNTNYFSFDGTNDRGYVKTLNYGGGSTISEMSVFAWIRTTYNSGTTGVWDNNNWALLDFDRSDGFTFTINGTGEIQMSGASSNYGGFSTNYDLVGSDRNNDGNWHYVGWTFSVANQEIVMYVDGQVDATFTANGSMTALGSGVTRYGIVGDGSEAVSEGGSGNNIYYDGDIGVIHFYGGKVLTPTEITQNFNALKGRYGL